MIPTITTDLPLVCPVRRKLPSGDVVDLPARIAQEWARIGLAGQVRGKRIAIGIGSRGVAGIDVIARELVSQVRHGGGDPFIVPAMGSHGGATPEGQRDVLRSLGVTEARVGCPILATMDAVQLGATTHGLPVYFDRYAAEADGIIIVNRVKMHTDFHAPTESGLLKMLAIGLGKERGAALVHSFGLRGIRDLRLEVASVVLEKISLLAGIATVEDGYHRPIRLEAFRSYELIDGEQRLMELARQLAPRLPVDDIDVLVIDEIGKDVSGSGMDTNIIGRLRIEGAPEPESPRVKAIVVLDLTDASHGNALGIGLADFTTRRLLDKIDFKLTAKNVFTSGFLERGKVPLVYETDAEAIDAALTHVCRANPQNRANARVVRIRNTLELEQVFVSPNLLDEIRADASFISVEKPQALTL
jgi:hypothetical protein